jgi:hypothetical protein
VFCQLHAGLRSVGLLLTFGRSERPIAECPQEAQGPRKLVRRGRHVAGLSLLVWIVTLLGAASAQAAPTYSCTPAADCSGWSKSITWTVPQGEVVSAGCESKTFTADTLGSTEVCTTAAPGAPPVTVQVNVKVDNTPPAVAEGRPARTPDAADGWYNHPVEVTFAGSDATSGIGTCTTATYGGPDSATAGVLGTCTDLAGNVSEPLGYGLRYDATPPVVTAAQPERPPDKAGWYVGPVRFDFVGTDATSGLESCAPVTYSGPDGAGVEVVAWCRDRAGNTRSRAFPLNYDTLPPLLTLTAASGDRTVSLSWETSPDAESVRVLRTPGIDGDRVSVVFSGPGARFVDRRVDNGARYAYEVQVADAAGNASAQRVVAIPGAPPVALEPQSVAPTPVPGPHSPSTPRTFSPAPGTIFVTGRGPLLQWPRVRRATYYNLQLLRGGRKVLSVWPRRARYQLKLRWRFQGKRHRLIPGRYRWIVWPGYGRRSKGRYGKPVVRSTFEVAKGPAARASSDARRSRRLAAR